MELREADAADRAEIRRVARASLTASYSHVLDEELIEHAVEEWYDESADGFADDAVYVVAEADDGLAGFSQSHLVGGELTVGEIAWLHVDPDYREQGLGTRLLERTERALEEHGAALFRGRVLAANEAGDEFYASHGYEESDERAVEIGDRTFTEETFVKWAGEEAERAAPLDPRRTPEGRTVYVAYDESERASKAPLYVVYANENREDRYGWFCGNCESFEVGMDTMGSVECNECGNWRKPTRWDAAYL